MVSKILKVFYGADYLPYKDSERTIHFPVGGNTFAGTQNTFRICFYPRDLVGSNELVEQTSWVLVSKLPNGQLGYQLLNAINTDSDLGEKYLLFDLSSYYSQYKGVVKLAIRGYQGEISFVEDEDTGTYSVQGTPIIGVTGTIDIAINYSPMVYGEELLPSELDQLVAMFSQYLTLNAYQEDSIKRIVVVDNLDEEIATLTNTYEHGQLFYNKADKKIYVFDETEDDIVLFDNAVKIIEGASNTLTINEVIANGTPVIVVLHNNIRHTTMPYLVSQTQNNTRKTIEAMPLYDNSISYSALNTQLDFSGLFTTLLVSDYKIELATKEYVDEQISSFLQNEYSKVDTTTYPTLNDFLASEGEQGYIYLYPINTSDPTQGYYQYIWEDDEWVSLGTTQIDLSGYVEKTSSANKVYGTNELGAQTAYTVDDFYDGNIARRDSDGSITVPLTPTQNGHASSKKYVDDLTTLKTLNGVDLHGTGNIAYDDELDSVSTNAVQNKVLNAELTATKDELAQLKAVVYETTIEEDSFEEQHLQESALPLSVNSKSIVFSAGMDNTDIKGRSFVYNQMVNPTSVSDNDHDLEKTIDTDGHTLIFNGTASSTYRSFGNLSLIAGHKYLMQIKIISNPDNISLAGGFLNQSGIVTDTISSGYGFVLLSYSSGGITYGIKSYANGTVFNNFKMTMCVFDLTQSNIDSATTVDEAIALLQQNGINPYEYNEYSTGKIIDSKPTAIVSKSSNFTELKTLPSGYKQVDYIESTGTQYIDFGFKPTTNMKFVMTFQLTNYTVGQGQMLFGSRNSADGSSDNSFTLGVTTSSGQFYAQYDSTVNIIATLNVDLLKHTSIISKDGWYVDGKLYRDFPSATQLNSENNFLCFAGYNGSATILYANMRFFPSKLYNNNQLIGDYVPCYRENDGEIGLYDLVSNTFFANKGTGTFLKGQDSYYHEYPLSLPVLRSAGSAQDDTKKVRIGVVNLGTLDWLLTGTSPYFVTVVGLPNAVGNSTEPANCVCPLYQTIGSNDIGTIDKTIAIGGATLKVFIKDMSYNDAATFKSAMNGVYLYYELATPTDQPSIALPENIEIEKGGSIEVIYDSTATTPSDFDFEVATYKPMEE